MRSSVNSANSGHAHLNVAVTRDDSPRMSHVPIDGDLGTVIADRSGILRAFCASRLPTVSSSGRWRIAHIGVIAKDPVSAFPAEVPSILREALRRTLRSGSCAHETTLGSTGASSEDIDDDAIYRVGAPYCAARTADHFYAPNILQHEVLLVQLTPQRVGVYALRPSITTRTLSPYRSVKPRMLIAQVFASIWAT
jgi:hypothetical protein